MLTVPLPSYSHDYLRSLGNFRFAYQNVGQVISSLLPLIFTGAGIALLIYLLAGGFKLLTSGGNPEQIARGQKMLTNAFIGFLIVISSYWIGQIIDIIFNLETTAPGDLEEPNISVIPNYATATHELSCNQVCANVGRICQSIGLNSDADDGQKWFYDEMNPEPQYRCYTSGSSCSLTVRYEGGAVCGGRAAQWTRCRCFSP